MSEEIRGNRDLIAWQKAKDLVPAVYKGQSRASVRNNYYSRLLTPDSHLTALIEET
jgi:hypothetical protein